MTAPHEATGLAKAVAEQAIGETHGDNDPVATRELQIDRAVVDRAVPPLPPPPPGRPMCAAWDDHERGERS